MSLKTTVGRGLDTKLTSQRPDQRTDVVYVGETRQGTDIGFHVDRFITSSSYIFAKRGGGKSYKTAELMEQIYKLGRQFCIVDPMGEYFTLKQLLGEDLVIYGNKHISHVDRQLSEEAIEEIRSLLVNGYKSVILNVQHMTADEAGEFLKKLLKPLHEKRLEYERKSEISPFIIAIEESERFIPEQGSSPSHDILSQLAYESRHSGIGMLLIGHRISKVDKTPLSQCDYPFIKQMTLDIDVDRVTEMMRIDYNVDPLTVSNLSGKIPSLKPNQSLFFQKEDVFRLQDYRRETEHYSESFGSGRMFKGERTDR